MSVCVIGRHGFIGSAIAKRFEDITSYPVDGTEAVYHFGSHSHQKFEENPDYHTREIVNSFLNLLPICREMGIPFIYASSALVYEKRTRFALTKLALEDLAASFDDSKTLGLRIFPVYGENETRSVISKWCREIAKDEVPVVYGDGTQARDFIYIDDVVDQILSLASIGARGVHDIGTGTLTTFNTIIDEINAATGKHIEPIYLPAPYGYSAGVQCSEVSTCRYSISDGIRKILGQ